MRIHLVSDLHLDHDADGGEAFLASLAPAPGVEILVVAGDSYSVARSHLELVEALHRTYPDAEILIVPGNHDYWRSSPRAVADGWHADFAADPRVHVALEPRALSIRGIDFFAGTLWYTKPRPGQPQGFIDYFRIEESPSWMFAQQALFETGLKTHANERTIVVSHHLPTSRSSPPEFAGTPDDHFFVCPLDEEILALRPRLWLHGHTHEPCDYVLGATRIICNPRGYPDEIRTRPPFQPLELVV